MKNIKLVSSSALTVLNLAFISSIFVATVSYAADPIDCDQSTCNDLANQYLENEDVANAIKFHTKGCELDSSASCYNIATIFTEDYYVERDFPKAVPFYVKACQLKDTDACTDLGDEYDDLEDYANALTYYDAGCQLNEGYGCQLQAWILTNNVEPRNLELATALYAKGCKLGNGSSCNNLAYDYMNYDEEPNPYAQKDYAKGIKLMTLACDTYEQANACTSLSKAYTEGHGVKKNLSESLRYSIRACEGLDPPYGGGCLNAGIDYDDGNGVKRDAKKALYYYELGCELDSSSACWNGGIMHENGEGIKENPLKARALYERACELGDEDACEEVAD